MEETEITASNPRNNEKKRKRNEILEEWFEKNLEFQKKKRKTNVEETSTRGPKTIIDLSKVLMEESFRLNNNIQDKRFSCGFLLDNSNDLKSTFTIKLYDKCFQLDIDGPDSFFPYEHSTLNFLKAIDSNQLTPELIDLLEETQHPCHFYNGCIVIEAQDYRNQTTNTNPIIHRILLKPTYSTLSYDAQAMLKTSSKDCNIDELLLLEQKLLLINNPNLCLDPSLQSAYINNILQFNKLKFNTKTKYVPSVDSPNVIQKPNKTIPLLKFLSNYEKKPDIPDRKPFTVVVHQIVNHIINEQTLKSLNINKDNKIPLSNSTPQNIQIKSNEVPQFQNLNGRKLRFSGNGGKTFCDFSVLHKRSGGFEGVIKVGKNPESNGNGDIIRFPLGNTSSSNIFLSQLKSLFEKDQALGTLTLDSLDPALIRKPGAASPPGTQKTPVPLSNTNIPPPSNIFSPSANSSPPNYGTPMNLIGTPITSSAILMKNKSDGHGTIPSSMTQRDLINEQTKKKMATMKNPPYLSPHSKMLGSSTITTEVHPFPIATPPNNSNFNFPLSMTSTVLNSKPFSSGGLFSGNSSSNSSNPNNNNNY